MKASSVARSWRLTTCPGIKGCDYSSGFRDHCSIVSVHSDITALPHFPSHYISTPDNKLLQTLNLAQMTAFPAQTSANITPLGLTRKHFNFVRVPFVTSAIPRVCVLHEKIACGSWTQKKLYLLRDNLLTRRGQRRSVHGRTNRRLHRCEASNKRAEITHLYMFCRPEDRALLITDWCVCVSKLDFYS